MNIQIKDRLVLAAKIIICIALIVLVYLIGIYLRKDIPLFEVKDIYVKSTANAKHLDDNMSKSWNLNVYQTNDIYLKFGHIDNMYSINEDDEILKSVVIENIQIVTPPKLGENVDIYTISKNEEKIFEYTQQYLVDERIEYLVLPSGANIYNLEVNNTSGQIALSFVNNNIIDYVYEGIEELTFDGTLLKNANIALEQIMFDVSFDLLFITQSDKEYIYNIQIKLPYGDIVNEGTVITDDMSNVLIVNKERKMEE